LNIHQHLLKCARQVMGDPATFFFNPTLFLWAFSCQV